MFISNWLSRIGLGQYIDTFCDNDIDQTVLTNIDDSDLKTLGVKSLGHRKKILAAIRSLDAVAPVSPETVLADFIGEQRQVTIIFSDISGFVALSHELGAEATHGLLSQYFQAVDGIIDRFGGWVDKHIGDNVMGIFGAPVAHKDDPKRAVMAAFEIRQAVADLALTLDKMVAVHIGIASGQVVASRTGSQVHLEYTVIGPAVNLAARLQGVATAGEIIVDEATCQLIGSDLRAIATEQVAIKGLPKPIRIWRALEFSPGQNHGQRTRLVGRQHEQQQFTTLMQRCLQNGQGQAFYVRGEAGIGKSCLIEHFKELAIAAGFHSYQIDILDFGGGQNDLWRELTTQLLATPADNGDDLVAQQRAIADQLIRNGSLNDGRQMYLNALLGLAQPAELQTLYEMLDNQTRQRETIATVTELVIAMGHQRPCLLVIEDVHWLDDTTLAQLPQLAQTVSQSSVLLVVTSRIEGDPIDANWLDAVPSSVWSTYTLQPLEAEDTATIAHRYPNLSAHFIENCIQRAEGNPLFLEQLLQAGETVDVDALPGTVQSVVLNRVDGLARTDRQALQAAAVLGRYFLSESLHHVLGHRHYDLSALLAHQLIEPDGDGYRFSHALIRDGVYRSLLGRDRRQFHRQAATWYENQDIERWAIHLDEAGDATAPIAYRTAAQHHFDQFRYSRALSLVDRGLALASNSESRYGLTQLKARLAHALGNGPEAIVLHQEAAALATTPVEAAYSWIGVAACVRLLGRYQDGLDALQQAKANAIGSGASRALSQIHYFQGCFCYSAGDLEGCLSENTQALHYAQQVDDPELIARAMSNLGDAYYARCQIHTAFSYYDRCVKLAEANRLGQVEIANRAQLAVMYRYLHDLETAIAENKKTVTVARQISDLRTLMYAYDTQGEFLTEQGQLDAAHQSLAEAWALSERLGNRRYRAYIMQRQSRVWIERGDHKTARTVLEEALTICRDTDMRFVSPRVLGQLARVAHSHNERLRFLAEGQNVLSQGCISHNFLWYYYDAMEACLEAQDWQRANDYAQALETYAATEPFPRSQFWVTRCRTLAALGQGDRHPSVFQTLANLRSEAEAVGFRLGVEKLYGFEDSGDRPL
ncbi:MAG: adenylate/guanylate cyclase domain-containing protein [Elainellaceae cyanobacterium]